MTVREIELDKICSNPFQQRQVYNGIETLARTIAAHGLQQIPKARYDGDGVQLKFGHRRAQAFRWLRENWKIENLPSRYSEYAVMPLDVEEITVKEMNIGVIVENAQRDDLTVIEEAQMMRDYGTRWDETSEQIGEKFGKNGATVRGIIRLLDLPEVMQDKLVTGEISQGAARILLSAQKLINADDMLSIVQRAQENPDEGTLEYQLDDAIGRLDHVLDMWRDEKGKKPQSQRYGNGWALGMKKFPNELIPSLTYEDVIKGLRIAETPRLSAVYDALREAREISYFDLLAKLKETNDPEAARIEWLLQPGACNVCPYYAVIAGNHYCGMDICHKRKNAAWKKHLFQKAIKDLGIPVYQSSDGPYRLLDDDTEKGLWAKKNKDLRLLPQGAAELHGYQWLEGFDRELGYVVLTGATLKARKEAAKKKDTKVLEEAMGEDDQVAAILERADFVLAWETSRAVSQKYFEGWSEVQVQALRSASYGWRSFHTPPGLTFADEGFGSQVAVFIGRNILEGAENKMEDDEYELEDCKQASEIAEHWGRVVSTLGCKPPKLLAKLAAEFDTQIAAVRVAVETPQQDKVKK
jgi:ParB/RepB/Spo0J family partition protein